MSCLCRFDACVDGFPQGAGYSPSAQASSANSAAWPPLSLLLNMHCLLNNSGRALSYRSLVRQVQGYDCSSEEARKLLKVHIYNLRKKIEPLPEKPTHILNVRGFGYLFERRRFDRETLSQSSRSLYQASNWAVKPPSTKSWVPVMNEASSLAKKAAAWPISCGRPMRFITCRCSTRRCCSAGSS